MFLQQLFEAIDKRHAAFCFGRMNPPTLGHGQLIDTVANAAAGGDYFIFVSQTQDSKKNPLDYQTKIKFVKAMFPGHARHVVEDIQLRTIIQIAQWLYNKGYRAVTFVAGGDRIAGFTELLNKYNGQGQEGDAGYYKFDMIKVASSGDRDPDAEGLAGVSATAARSAAAAGDLSAFAQATGAGELSKPLYDAVRQGMLLDESVLEDSFNGINISLEIQKDDEYVDDEDYDNQVIYVTASSKGKELGYVLFSFDGEYLMPQDLEVDERYRGQGVAAAMYDYVKSRGYKIRRSGQQTDAGTGFWDKHRPNQNVWEQGVTECSGYIPKNKREAKDPRFSHALTVDVKTDTPTKNMKALKLV